MLAGQQNQIQNLSNESNTNLGLLAQANAMYNNDLNGWLGGVNAGTGLYGAASNAVTAGANSTEALMQAMAQESQARVVNPSIAAANYASANLSNAQAAQARYALQQAQALDKQKAENVKALEAQYNSVASKTYPKTTTERVAMPKGLAGFFSGVGAVFSNNWNNVLDQAQGYSNRTVTNSAYTNQQKTLSNIQNLLANQGVVYGR